MRRKAWRDRPRVKPVAFPIDPESGKIDYSRALVPRHEKFVRELLTSGDPLEAYCIAFKCKRKSAYGKYEKLLENIHVQARIKQYLKGMKDRMAWDVNKVLDSFETIYNKALDGNDLGNANRAVENVGKHLGMFVERVAKIELFKDVTDEKIIDAEMEHLANVAGVKLIENKPKEQDDAGRTERVPEADRT